MFGFGNQSVGLIFTRRTQVAIELTQSVYNIQTKCSKLNLAYVLKL